MSLLFLQGEEYEKTIDPFDHVDPDIWLSKQQFTAIGGKKQNDKNR